MNTLIMNQSQSYYQNYNVKNRKKFERKKTHFDSIWKK